MMLEFGKIEFVESGFSPAPDISLNLDGGLMTDSILPEFLPFPNRSFLDLTNRQFVLLTVIGYVGIQKGRGCLWLCKCQCGNMEVILGRRLMTGRGRSCRECYQRPSTAIHGAVDTVEYEAYSHAKRRCNIPKDPGYKNYGGRGIEFRFESFPQFLAEIGPRPTPKHSLDRKDNDGHYEIGNVRWATKKEQERNRTTNRFLTINGIRLCIAEWAELTNKKHQYITASTEIRVVP